MITSQSISYFELTAVIRGPIEYVLDNNRYVLNSGDAIFLPVGTVRERMQAEKVDYISYNFTTEDEFALPLVIRGAITGEAALIIAAHDKITETAHIDNTEKLEGLLLSLLAVLEDYEKNRQLNPLTRKIIEYIHSGYKKKITLEDIGTLTYFSPVYCDTVFRRDTGKPIIDYLLSKRTDEAKKLLLEGVLPLSRVAEEVGFTDYNYFSRTFKKRTGYTPGAYRALGGK